MLDLVAIDTHPEDFPRRLIRPKAARAGKPRKVKRLNPKLLSLRKDVAATSQTIQNLMARRNRALQPLTFS